MDSAAHRLMLAEAHVPRGVQGCTHGALGRTKVDANIDRLLLAQAVFPQGRTALMGGSPLDRAYALLNRIVAAMLLAALAPALAWIAWCVRQEDGGPVMFAHYRVGQRGQLFRCLKFRTMVRDSDGVLAELLRNDPQARAEWNSDRKLRRDPRVTRIGRRLRTTSLDELPQLLNVLRGDMLLVGPRPVTLSELRDHYSGAKRHYLSVKPGLTGLWQVSGRNDTSYRRRVHLDAQYVERRNPAYDLWILSRTVKVLITREGAW